MSDVCDLPEIIKKQFKSTSYEYKCMKCGKEFGNIFDDRKEFYRMINHKCEKQND